MSRYIDADALKDKLQQHHDFYVKAWGGFSKMPIGEQKRLKAEVLLTSIKRE